MRFRLTLLPLAALIPTLLSSVFVGGAFEVGKSALGSLLYHEDFSRTSSSLGKRWTKPSRINILIMLVDKRAVYISRQFTKNNKKEEGKWPISIWKKIQLSLYLNCIQCNTQPRTWHMVCTFIHFFHSAEAPWGNGKTAMNRAKCSICSDQQ